MPQAHGAQERPPLSQGKGHEFAAVRIRYLNYSGQQWTNEMYSDSSARSDHFTSPDRLNAAAESVRARRLRGIGC